MCQVPFMTSAENQTQISVIMKLTKRVEKGKHMDR